MSQTATRVADERSRKRAKDVDVKPSAPDSTRSLRTDKATYELERLIAPGSTASVWLARDANARTEVAIKRLEPASVSDRAARRRLEAEASATSAISHPGVVPVIDSVFGNDVAALVFPFVPGETLSQRLRSTGKLDPRTAATISLDVADVLTAAHAAGIVHRDVKPGNILLGSDGRTRLLDFGIARTSDGLPTTGSPDAQALPALDQTRAGMAIGTLPYMAPERLTGGPSSEAADVFALGVVLYETLSGRRPYPGRSPDEQLALQQQPVAEIDGAPEALAALILEALDVRPERRPSAAQFARALRGWLDGRTEAEEATAVIAAAAPPVIRPATKRRVVSPPTLIGAAVAGLTVLVVAALALIAASGSAPPESSPGLAAIADATLVPSPGATPGPTQTSATPAPGPSADSPTAPQIKNDGGGGSGGDGGGGRHGGKHKGDGHDNGKGKGKH
jgi:hypothetical protein